MENDSWLEKGERLRAEFARLGDEVSRVPAAMVTCDRESMMRAGLARWLREEFAGEPPVDPGQLALLPEFADGDAGRLR